MRLLYWLSLILVIVGGINWGLVGGFEYDLVANLFGVMTPAARAIYCLVGLAAVFLLIKSVLRR